MVNVMGLVTVVAVTVSAVDRERLLDAWQDVHRQRPNHVRMTSNASYPAHDVTSRDQFEFKRTNASMSFFEKFVETHQGNTRETVSCWVVNPHYAFEVQRVSPDAGWMLVSLARAGTEDYEWFVNRLQLHDAVTTNRGIMIGDTYLWEILEKTRSQLLVDPTEPNRCKLLFCQTGDEPFTNSIGLPFRRQEGSVILNAQRGWVVESAELQRLGGGVETDLYHYDSSNDFVPVEMVTKHDQGVVVRKIVEREYGQAFSESDFRLTAFGLPEPSDVEDDDTQFLWLIGLGAVLLMFCGVWLLRARAK